MSGGGGSSGTGRGGDGCAGVHGKTDSINGCARHAITRLTISYDIEYLAIDFIRLNFCSCANQKDSYGFKRFIFHCILDNTLDAT